MKDLALAVIATTLFAPSIVSNIDSHLLAAAKVEQNQEDMVLPANELDTANFSGNTLYQVLSAEMALYRGQHDVALANYIAAAKATQDPAIAERATQVALALKGLEAAIEPGLIWSKAAPDNLEAQITMAAIYVRLGEVNNAVPYLIKLNNLSQEDSSVHFLSLYKQLQEPMDREHVVAALEQMTLTPTPVPNAHIALAEIYLNQNELDKAQRHIETAIKMDGDNINTIKLYSQTLVQIGQTDKAIALMEEKIALFPEDKDLSQFFIEMLIEEGALTKARQQLKQLMEKELTPQESLQLARVGMQVGWYEESKALLLDAKDDNSIHKTAEYFLARIAELQENQEEAVKWYKEVTDGPFHVISYLRAGVILGELKQFDRALIILDMVDTQSMQDMKRVVIAKTEVYTTAKQYQEGYDLLSDELKQHPDDIDLLYTRAILAEKMNKIDLAEQDLRSILSQLPEHVDALNALGYILADRTDRYDEALNYINMALKLSPENPSILDSLGWVHYKMGNYEDAVTHLRKAFDITPDPEIAAHLGEVLWKKNQQAEATRVWEDALKTNPNHPYIKNTMERIMGR